LKVLQNKGFICFLLIFFNSLIVLERGNYDTASSTGMTEVGAQGNTQYEFILSPCFFVLFPSRYTNSVLRFSLHTMYDTLYSIYKIAALPMVVRNDKKRR